MKIRKVFIAWFVTIIVSLIMGFFLIGYSMDFKSKDERTTEALIEERNEEISKEAKEIKYVMLGEKKIKVELALTKEDQAQGLSGRISLKENEGMLFVFDKPGEHNFWMKDMKFPIDIIWIDENFNMVIYIKKDARPGSYPETYGPSSDSIENAKYVLEVPSGFAEKNNLKIGDRVGFENKEGIPINN